MSSLEIERSRTPKTKSGRGVLLSTMVCSCMTCRDCEEARELSSHHSKAGARSAGWRLSKRELGLQSRLADRICIRMVWRSRRNRSSSMSGVGSRRGGGKLRLKLGS